MEIHEIAWIKHSCSETPAPGVSSPAHSIMMGPSSPFSPASVPRFSTPGHWSLQSRLEVTRTGKHWAACLQCHLGSDTAAPHPLLLPVPPKQLPTRRFICTGTYIIHTLRFSVPGTIICLPFQQNNPTGVSNSMCKR